MENLLSVKQRSEALLFHVSSVLRPGHTRKWPSEIYLCVFIKCVVLEAQGHDDCSQG